MTIRNRRFDILEVALIALLMTSIGIVTGFSRANNRMNATTLDALSAESRALARKYGPDTNSEHEEEWIIRDFFGGRRNGVFVDVGANDYQHFSNTYYLETTLGWSGIAIEPLKEFEAGYLAHRPLTRFRSFFVSDASNETAKMYYLKSNTLVTSADRDFTARSGSDTQEISAPTITLNDLLAVEHVDRFDFLSMDIELHEPQALAGFDIQRYMPALVCIEAHPEVRQQILDYFLRNNYVVVGKYLRADTQNLYFTPATTLAAHSD